MVYNLVKVKQNASRHHSKSNPSYEQRKILHLPHKHETPPMAQRTPDPSN